jgi:predicted transposase YbfD/YdcC
MEQPVPAEFLRPWQAMPEPRHHNHLHPLLSILVIALLAVLCGAENWTEVACWGRLRKDWLRTFLDLPSGVPSHDTFSEVFARLDPEAFEACFAAWIASVTSLSKGQLLAIDGKSLRRSFSRGWDKQGMSHMVSAFVQANRLVFAQVQADGKGQELEAIFRLLELLDLQGAVVTTDALGCQKQIAAKIKERGGEYLLQVKDNQSGLREAIQRCLAQAQQEQFAGWRCDQDEQTDGDHGRIEIRRALACWDVSRLGDLQQDWPGLQCMLQVQCTRQIGEQISTETHYYISSLNRRRTARKLAGYARGHWSVENHLHWQLDVSFDEDHNRSRKGHGAENFSRLRRIALNLLQQESSLSVGIKAKRKCCGWDLDYLLKVFHP